MWVLISVLSLLLVISIITIVVLVKRLMYTVELLDNVHEHLDDALATIDKCYSRVAAKAELELMSDEPVVRELVDDIKMCKGAILHVAHCIVDPFESEDDNVESENNEQQ